jgi:hypothetical protein
VWLLDGCVELAGEIRFRSEQRSQWEESILISTGGLRIRTGLPPMCIVAFCLQVLKLSILVQFSLRYYHIIQGNQRYFSGIVLIEDKLRLSCSNPWLSFDRYLASLEMENHS